MKQIDRFGVPVEIPDKFKEPPKLNFELELYYVAFLELNLTRQIGMDVSPISFGDILSYASFYGFSHSQTDDLLFYIRQMDTAWRENNGKKSQ